MPASPLGRGSSSPNRRASRPLGAGRPPRPCHRHGLHVEGASWALARRPTRRCCRLPVAAAGGRLADDCRDFGCCRTWPAARRRRTLVPTTHPPPSRRRPRAAAVMTQVLEPVTMRGTRPPPPPGESGWAASLPLPARLPCARICPPRHNTPLSDPPPPHTHTHTHYAPNRLMVTLDLESILEHCRCSICMGVLLLLRCCPPSIASHVHSLPAAAAGCSSPTPSYHTLGGVRAPIASCCDAAAAAAPAAVDAPE